MAQPNCKKMENDGDDYVKENNYGKALKSYFAAKDCDPTRAKIINQKIENVFTKVEKQRKEAEVQRKIAVTERSKAEASRAVAVTAQMQAQKATQMAIAAENKTQKALAKADSLNLQNQGLVKTIFFYEDSLAVAYGNKSGKYGFVNKDGKVLIDYQYSKTGQFEEPGFAKVIGRDDNDYLIDLDFGQNNLI
jgi:hypothetical protein